MNEIIDNSNTALTTEYAGNPVIPPTAPPPINVGANTPTAPVNPVIPPVNTTTTNSAETAPKPPTSQDQLDTIDTQEQKAYKEFNKTVTGIQNNSIPLNAGEQAQVESLKSEYQNTINELKSISASAVGSAKMNAYRMGAGEDGNFQQTISAIMTKGASNIADMTTKMAGAVAQLTQALKDNKIKNIKLAYDAYTNLADKRAARIQKTIDDATSAMRDARDFALKKKQVDLDMEKTRTEIKKLNNDIAATGSATLGNSPFAQNIKTAMAAIKFSSVAEKEGAQSAIVNLLAQGDIQGARDQLATYAYNSMSTPQQTVLDGKRDTIAALQRIKDRLKEFKAAGGNTNVFTGLKQKALEKFGYAGVASDIANDIALAIVDYRRAISGAAFTESEANTYNALFPSTGKTPELNDAKISTILKKLETDTNNALARKIPKYAEITKALEDYQNNPDGLTPTTVDGLDPNDPEGLY